MKIQLRKELQVGYKHSYRIIRSCKSIEEFSPGDMSLIFMTTLLYCFCKEKFDTGHYCLDSCKQNLGIEHCALFSKGMYIVCCKMSLKILQWKYLLAWFDEQYDSRQEVHRNNYFKIQ